jgi:hypothetical protein
VIKPEYLTEPTGYNVLARLVFEPLVEETDIDWKKYDAEHLKAVGEMIGGRSKALRARVEYTPSIESAIGHLRDEGYDDEADLVEALAGAVELDD